MMPLIGLLAARLGFIPEPLRKVVAWIMLILAALLIFGAAKVLYDRAIIREHEREISDEVRERTDKGNAAATEAANATKAEVEESNRRASEAAKDSDDPLKAGLDKLR